MSSKLREALSDALICDKCGRNIHQGGTWYEVKNKRLRKRGLDVVCHCCAEGIIKEWESAVKE